MPAKRRRRGFRRTGRRRNIYLGHRVPDTRKPGLDNLREVEGISRAIVQDYRRGRINRRKALRRLNFLKLIVSRDRDFQGRKKLKALKIIDRYRDRL